MGREGAIGEARTALPALGDATRGPDLAVILDTVELPTVVVGPDCRVVHFNRAATTVLRLKPEDIGRSAGDALTGISDLDNLCAQVMSDQTQHRLEIRKATAYFFSALPPASAWTDRAGL